MEADFWQARWANNQIGFHEGKTNAFLEKYFDRLALPPGARVFVPLCGKTRDIAWLLSRGVKVAGAELCALAVAQLFEELGVEPTITAMGPLMRYAAPSIEIFQGDIFQLTADALGPVDAVYDRAALVALPAEMRRLYTRHILELTGGVPQLLLVIAYDQSAADGPPFAVGGEEVHAHYDGAYTIAHLDCQPLPGGLKGKCEATDNAWLLTRAKP
ncbi:MULTISPECIES: thiopurine S-methyltransferase [unclassified Xanthobacter]|uniref:thiopurine S-methyltransferase n=1 Tax=unclassified Xanthobacter TaxID=2623496 RepID=UPI001EFFFB75|nr:MULTISPECIES: thiopurine S-methyltransferase [unclassified Xanthobacter]